MRAPLFSLAVLYFLSLSAKHAVAADLTDIKPPNVLFIMSDDMGWKDVGYHGSDLSTPSIDQLAATGTRFDRYYAFPMCWPTRTALLTGRMTVRMGLEYRMSGVPADETLLPEVFQANGYQTWMVGKWHLANSKTSQFPHRRGFEHFYGHTAQGIDYFTHINRGALDWQRNGTSVRETGYSTELLTAEAIRLLSERDKKRPFFLYVAYNAPHSPLQVPEQYLDQVGEFDDENRKTYAAMVKVMDNGIGEIVSKLEQAGIRDETIIVWASDNGGSQIADNGDLRGGKSTIWEGGIRVPALVNWPNRIESGAVLSQQIIAYDWLPTLVDATGMQFTPIKPLDGHNMWPAMLRGEQVAPATRVMGHSGSRAVFHKQWKLVRTVDRGESEQKDFLFNLSGDPNETHDLAAQHPELIAQLAKLMPAVAPRPEGNANAGRPGQPRMSPMERFDADNDGKLAKEEAGPRMLEQFDTLDKDGDGFLDSAELADFPGPRRGRPGGRLGAPRRGPSAGAGRENVAATEGLPVAEAAIKD